MNDAGYIFETIKEHRGSYFVEYTPALAGDYFASLALVFTEQPKREEIPPIMEQESKRWIQRYPVPITTTALNYKDDVIPLEDIKGCNHVIALRQKNMVSFHWKFLGNDELTSDALEESRLLEIYHDIPHTTKVEITQKFVSSASTIRLGLVIIALWGIAVPLAVGIIGFSNPILGGLVIAYSISKAGWRAMKMLGYIDRSEREKRKSEEELRMRHHHYHCERNPEGFMRLKAENFERDTREQIQQEAEELRRLQSKTKDSA